MCLGWAQQSSGYSETRPRHHGELVHHSLMCRPQYMCTCPQHDTLERVCCLVPEHTALPPSLSPLPQLLLTILTSLAPSSQLACEILALAVHLSSLLFSFMPTRHVISLLYGLENLIHLYPLPQLLAVAIPHLLKCCGHLTLPQSARVSSFYASVD